MARKRTFRGMGGGGGDDSPRLLFSLAGRTIGEFLPCGRSKWFFVWESPGLRLKLDFGDGVCGTIRFGYEVEYTEAYKWSVLLILGYN